MAQTQVPMGTERQVKFLGGANIDGAPVAYIVVLAAVVAALSFLPFSVVLASGGSFPMSQGIYPMVGWILGPIAGAVATAVGAILGVFLAPHTAGVPLVTIWSATLASFAAGTMVLGEKRSKWWIAVAIIVLLEWLNYVGRAIFVNGVGAGVAIACTFNEWSALILFVLPTRTLFARWIHGSNVGKLALGLGLGTWMIAGFMHVSASTFTYMMFNWPQEVWITLIPIVPVEHLARCLIGVVIGTGVIVGLRAIGLVKPAQAIY
jgi:hypothetical protein